MFQRNRQKWCQNPTLEKKKKNNLKPNKASHCGASIWESEGNGRLVSIPAGLIIPTFFRCEDGPTEKAAGMEVDGWVLSVCHNMTSRKPNHSEQLVPTLWGIASAIGLSWLQ